MEQLVLGRQPAGQTHPDDSSVELQAGEKMHGASEKAALTWSVSSSISAVCVHACQLPVQLCHLLALVGGCSWGGGYRLSQGAVRGTSWPIQDREVVGKVQKARSA